MSHVAVAAPAPPTSVNALALGDLLTVRAREQPSAAAYVFLEGGELATPRTLTYGALRLEAARFAALLQTAVADGAPVLIALPAGLDALIAFFGCLLAGAIPIPSLAPRNARAWETLGRIALDAGAQAVVTTPAARDRAARVMALPSGLEAARSIALDDARGGSDDLVRPQRRGNVAYLQYTSGSTGHPKGVMVTHRSVLANLCLLRDSFNHSAATIVGGWVPHSHDMGLVGILLYPLFLGSRCVFMSPEAFLQRPARWLEAIARYGVHASAAPTFAYGLCCDKAAGLEPAVDLSSWTTAIVGAEPVRARTLERFAATFERNGFEPSSFWPSYGLAEATLFVTGAQWDASIARQGTAASGTVGVGQPFRVVDAASGAPAADGAVGEIWVRHPSVTAGYWNRPDDTSDRFAATLANDDMPYLRTQDLGVVHGGHLFVVGRTSTLCILQGRNLFAEDIEEAADGCHESTIGQSVAAFTVQRETDDSERLVLVQEVRRTGASTIDGPAVAAAIQRAVGDALDARASHILLVRPGTIARTPNGKLRRGRCRAAFLDGTLPALHRLDFAYDRPAADPGAADAPAPTDSVGDWLTRRIAHEVHRDPEELSRTDPFASFGLTSLQMIAITAELSQVAARELEPTFFWEYPSIDAAVDRLTRA